MSRLSQWRERGAALVIALMLLLVMTIIGIAGMSSSTLELRMSGNTQMFYNAFQSAECGISATMAKGENFDGKDKTSAEVVKDCALPTVMVTRLYDSQHMECPRKGEASASSVGFLECEYYDVDSDYDASGAAPAHIYQGVAKEVLAP